MLQYTKTKSDINNIKWSAIFPYFTCFWLAETVCPQVYLRVSWLQMAFAGQLQILYLVANEIVCYCEELAIILTRK